MTGTHLAAFSTAFQSVLGSLFTCSFVVGAVTISSAARSPWRKAVVYDDIGGGAREVDVCSVRVLRTALGAQTVKPNVTTCTVDGTTAIVTMVSDIKNDNSLTLSIRALQP